MRGFYKHPCAFLASARLVRAVMPIQGPVRPYLANSVCKHLQAPVRTLRTVCKYLQAPVRTLRTVCKYLQAPVRTLRTLCFYMGAKTTHPYTVFRRVCAWSTTSFKEPVLKTVITTKTSHNACACTRGGCTDTVRERVCTGSWEKNLLPHRGLEPASALCLWFFGLMLYHQTYSRRQCSAQAQNQHTWQFLRHLFARVAVQQETAGASLSGWMLFKLRTWTAAMQHDTKSAWFGSCFGTLAVILVLVCFSVCVCVRVRVCVRACVRVCFTIVTQK